MLRSSLFLAVMTCVFASEASARTGFAFVLTGAAEIPPLTTTATGSGIAVLSDAGDTLLVSFAFRGLLGDYAASHIHGPGTPTQLSGLRFTLEAVVAPDLRSGTCENRYAIPASEVTWLTSGLFYVNIHSLFAPNGELRGQILADATPTRRSSFARLKALYR